MDLNNKIAIVTGGAQGVGRAITLALLNKGMKVCICDINQDLTNQFIETLPDTQKSNIIFTKCDVSLFSEFKTTFEKVQSAFGKIDLLVNNAGLVDEHDWERMVGVNFVGVIHGIKLAFHYMNKNEGGHGGFVINIGSNAGFEPFELAPVYAGCKHGINGLTKSYGTEFHWERTGIKVNAVCPGPVDTALFYSFPDMCLDKEVAGKHNNSVKFIQPEEVADAVLFVVGENKNGALLRVDCNGRRYIES
ncbi:unnamed protein product [Larinioides sclopetarius]|uniref:15-hydroxyprostaglandin dehydrogenase [NAD(+)] n=1 Tax=Larinioides sclopetarius TaxID=280406 RepID=A0AAV2ASK2_9ARAC